ncbi:STY4528 family pathogenicity island replication protein [Pseudomonas silesiensis]|uniref:STY4528 family pathogenicity island replication protein n=1 Tax=Pseudomonas silesiensis TaxID=1853130 RepID=UPI0034D5E768
MEDKRRTGGPVPLGELFDKALTHLRPAAPESTQSPEPNAPADGFLFSGNRHDSVPRALLLDRRLTPLERNAWQVFRLMLENDGITALPTYDQLAPWLASMPCAARASHETVARTLTILRLTRWLSLVRRQRDPRTGRILSNLYVLHDEPLTPYEAIQLDADYLELVSQSLTHASKSIQRVGVTALQELTQDPMLRGQMLPSRLEILSQRLATQGWNTTLNPSQPVDNSDSEESKDAFLRNRPDLASEFEERPEASKTDPLRIPKSDSTVRKKENSKKEVRTVPRMRLGVGVGVGILDMPDRFMALKAEQQSGALAALQAVDVELHQAVIDEWVARCRASSVRNPAGYLFGIIQKAMRGEFRAWAGQKPSSEPTTSAQQLSPAPPSPSMPASPEVAEKHLSRLRELLGKH